jgi:hypothetical protein
VSHHHRKWLKRKWLKDLLQYGRRSVQLPGDAKSPLLWAADLPRLGRMWMGHVWFRTWFDLRTTPPRVTYDPREVYSRDVYLIRPTTLQPIRPVQATRDAFAAFQRWLDDGGLEQAIARLGRGVAGGVAGTLGAVVLGAVALVGTLTTGLVGLFGASAIGTALGVNALGRGVETLAQRSHAGLLALGDGFAGGFRHLAGRLQRPQDTLWTFATLTGTVGLILLMVLQASGLPGAATRATAADSHTAHRPPAQLAQVDAKDDTFGGLPDPFARESEPALPSDGFEDPFGNAPVDMSELPESAAALELNITRTQLPPDVARFNVPDDPEEFLVESASPVADPSQFPDDDWLTAAARVEVDRQPVVPAAYRESSIAPIRTAPLPAPSESADRFVPATRNIGVTIRKTQPASTKTGETLWYDLIVTNHGDEAVAGLVVEERVASPHRVADTYPAASFADGVLTWKLDELAAGAEHRLSVAVYPMSSDAIATTAAIRPIATFSAVTLVQAEEPVVEEPLVDEPTIEEPPVVEERPPEVPTAPVTFRRVRIVMTTPEWVREQSGCLVTFDVTNTGTAALTGVVVRGQLPPGLKHPHGPTVESLLGDLPPGATRRVTLHAQAETVGEAELVVEVRSAEQVATTVRGTFNIVEQLPQGLSAVDDFGPARNDRR